MHIEAAFGGDLCVRGKASRAENDPRPERVEDAVFQQISTDMNADNLAEH